MSQSDSTRRPPQAVRRDHSVESAHGVRNDPFFWLRERESTEVVNYLNAENAYVEHALTETRELQDALYREIRERVKEDDETAPYKDGEYWYYSRYELGSEYPVYARRDNLQDAPEQVLLDVAALAHGHEFFSVQGVSVSPNGERLAYFFDTTGRRQYTLRILDIESGASLAEGIHGLTPGAVWSADSNAVVFVRNDPDTLRASEAQGLILADGKVHSLYTEQDETYTLSVDATRSERYVLLTSVSTMATEVRVLDARDVLSPGQVFLPRVREHEYFVDHADDQFLICTNFNARNFCIRSSDRIGRPAIEWHDVIAHRDDVLIEDFHVFRDDLVVEQVRLGLAELEVMRRASGQRHVVQFDDPTYTASIGDNHVYDTSLLRFEYESMTTPPSVFDYDMTSREQTLVKQDPVLGGFSSDDYVSERLWVTARDGERVPVSIVTARSTRATAEPSPLLLYAYGSYGYSIEPTFSYARLSLLERGFSFAIAHVRGGSDLGRAWYEAGKLEHKWNTFNDFIDVGRAMVAQQYTAHDRLYAMGGSAGGLLMGVVVNEAPTDYAGVVAAVPFVDVVTTMLDESIPLTTGEYDEWGDPREANDYAYMLSYSPYDNVREQSYPPMLVTAGLHDSQVQYWEPAKWVAKLREAQQGDAMLLLHTNMQAGHGGASGRFEAIRETALEYAFLLLLDQRRSAS